MSWLTVIWAMSAAVPLTLGVIHAAVWCQDRGARAKLMFAITLSAAQAAQHLLVRDMLADIVAEDRRADKVIQRMRAMLQRGETTQAPLSPNEVLEEVLLLTHADLISRCLSQARSDLAQGLQD